MCTMERPPVPQERTAKITKRLEVAREDVSQMTQHSRGKANIRYEKGGEHLFAKYVTRQAEGLDNIAGLAREARLLEKLADTGLVPTVKDFKMYPNEQKARLLLEELPGMSLDHMPSKERREFVEHAPDVIVRKTAEALQRVNNEGIHVVDINEGTFLFDQNADGDVDVRVLDLELGYDETEGVGEGLERALKFISRGDPAYCVSPEASARSVEELKKAEMFRWAKMLSQYIFPRRPVEVTVPAERKTEYDAYIARVHGDIEKRVAREIQRAFTRLKPERDAMEISGGEDAYVQKKLPYTLKNELRTASLPFTLPDVLKANNVTLDASATAFLAQCLSYDPTMRPENFHALLGDV